MKGIIDTIPSHCYRMIINKKSPFTFHPSIYAGAQATLNFQKM